MFTLPGDRAGRLRVGASATAGAFSVTTPLVVGGDLPNSTLTLQSTSNTLASGDYISFKTGAPATEKFKIDSSGRLLNSGMSGVAFDFKGSAVTPGFQLLHNTTTDTIANASIAFGRYSNDGTGPRLIFAKSRGTTIDARTPVPNLGDDMGAIVFNLVDGANYLTAAVIQGEVDGGVASTKGPGRLTFWTKIDGAGGALAERWRISNDGILCTNQGIGPFSPAGLAPKIQVHDTGIGASQEIWRWSADASPARLVLGKSTSATINSHTAAVPSAGDLLAEIRFLVDDISFYRYNAAIRYAAEGAPASGSVPVNLNFCTGITGITEQWRLDSGGHWLGNQSFGTIGSMTVNTLDEKLQINGNTSATAGMSIAMFSGSGGAGSAGGGGIGPHIDFYRSMNGTVGNATVLSTAGTGLGILNFYAAQQTGTLATQTLAAQITVELDGTATSGATVDMPTRMRISTMSDGLGGTPGSVDPIEAVRIDSKQCVGIGVTPSHLLDLKAGSTTIAPLRFASGTNLTTPAAGAVEYDGKVFYGTHVASARGVIDTEQFISTQGGTFTLTSQTAAQKMFNSPTNGAVTVAASTTYEYECWFALSAMSGSSGSFGFALGGTATVTFSNWFSEANKATLATAGNSQNTYNNNSVANTTLATANTNTVGWAYIRGTIRINAAGTLIPQVSLGVAAAAIVAQDSFFRIWPVGTNTVVSVGNWS